MNKFHATEQIKREQKTGGRTSVIVFAVRRLCAKFFFRRKKRSNVDMLRETHCRSMNDLLNDPSIIDAIDSRLGHQNDDTSRQVQP